MSLLISDDASTTAMLTGANDASVDATRPILTSFSTNADDDSYRLGDSIDITAAINETVQAGSSIIATLDTGATVVLSTDTGGNQLSGSYIVAADENSTDLTVNSYAITGVNDLAGNAMTTTAIPAANLALSSDIVIDTIAPDTTITDITLSADSGADDSDFKTNVALQTISATLSQTLQSGDVLLGSVDGGTSWTDISDQVTDSDIRWTGVTLTGASAIAFRVEDATGNSGATASVNYTIDTTSPAAPKVATPDAPAQARVTALIEGAHPDDGTTVSLYLDSDNDGEADDTTVIDTALVTDGAWSVSAPLNIRSDNNFVLIATDEAGNSSVPSDVPTITENTPAPVPPRLPRRNRKRANPRSKLSMACKKAQRPLPTRMVRPLKWLR